MFLTCPDSILLELAGKMRDPASVKAFALDPAHANPDPLFLHHSSWNDLSLAYGYPGFILLFSNLQRKGLLEEKEAEIIIHHYVLKIKEALEAEGLSNLSLFSGLSGVCYALHTSCREGKRYQRMLNVLHAFLLKKIEKAYLEPLESYISQQRASPSSLYDPIQGICGIGRYALENLSDPLFHHLAETITKTLIALCQPLMIGGKNVPGWFLSSADSLNVQQASLYPQGNFNLGLAHGVTGVLAFLSIAALSGIVVKKQEETIKIIANWIREKSFLDQQAIRWSYVISWEEEIEKKPSSRQPCKDAWCYGVPGISRSLFLAGKALNDENLKTFALTAFRSIFCRTREEWQLPGPNLCHGIGGLLLITHAMSKEKGNEDLSEQVNMLQNILLSFYHPHSPLGFKDIEPCKQGGQTEVSKPGLLEGTAGILLTLATLSDSQPPWLSPFFIHA